MTPTIGRIVIFHNGSNLDESAIITGVYPGEDSVIDLTTFPRGNTPAPYTRVSMGDTYFCWSWPVRVGG